MAFLKYNGIGITALAAAIPRQVIDNYKYNTKHSEAIITKDYHNAQKFLNEIDVVLLMRKPVQATFVSLPQKS